MSCGRGVHYIENNFYAFRSLEATSVGGELNLPSDSTHISPVWNQRLIKLVTSLGNAFEM